MVKLHYVNRKSEGIKLGQVVSKDLLKRIPPGSSHKTALRDPCVDLDVSGKALTDEGFAEVADALQKSICYQNGHERVVELEEISLKSNELTARCLRPLAMVIALAAESLRDVDLSDNRITITTNEHAAAWEGFLRAFSRCCVLRRIDFGGNVLGPKAFEILTRVYGQENSILSPSSVVMQPSPVADRHQSSTAAPSTPQKPARKASFASTVKLPAIKKPEIAQGGHDGVRQEYEHLDKRLLNAEDFQAIRSTKGLRSVPYIVFSDTSMGDTCALYLSYVIACHELPPRLLERIPPVKAGAQAQQLEAYDQIPGCHGIIYQPNQRIGSAGWKVLELAELGRKGFLRDIADEQDQEDDILPAEATNSARRVSTDARTSESPQTNAQRRRRTVSVMAGEHTTTPTSSTYDTELHRARSRIQGDSLRDLGPFSNDLWCTSLRMLSVARTVLLEPRKQHASPTKTSEKGMEQQRRLPVVLTIQPPAAVTKITSTSTVLGLGDPNLLIFPRLPTRRKEAVLLPSLTTNLAMTPVTSQTSSAIDRIHTPGKRAPESSPRLNLESNPPERIRPYRTSLPYGLPEAVWARIILLAAKGTGIVSEEQSLAVVRWARKRETLTREMEALGKAESAQIWRVLEAMGCLTYEIRM